MLIGFKLPTAGLLKILLNLDFNLNIARLSLRFRLYRSTIPVVEFVCVVWLVLRMEDNIAAGMAGNIAF